MFFNLRLNGYLRMETYDGGGSSGVFEVHGEGTFSVKLSRAIPLAWKTGNRSGSVSYTHLSGLKKKFAFISYIVLCRSRTAMCCDG